MLALIIMPVLIINVLITMNLAGGFDHWDDQFPAGLSVLAQPDSVVLGVRNATGPFRFLVKNKHHLPLVGAKVVLQVGPSRSTAPARPPFHALSESSGAPRIPRVVRCADHRWQVQRVLPEHDFDFCAGIIPGSALAERLGPVCTPAL